jgi:hypothetical protein
VSDPNRFLCNPPRSEVGAAGRGDSKRGGRAFYLAQQCGKLASSIREMANLMRPKLCKLNAAEERSAERQYYWLSWNQIFLQ